MAHKEPEIKKIYFTIGLVAAKARVTTAYIRNIGKTLGIPKHRGKWRKYTQKEMDYLVKICRTAKEFTKTELAIKVVNEES